MERFEEIRIESTNRAIELMLHEYDFCMDLRQVGESLEDAIERFNAGAWMVINSFTIADTDILVPLKDQLERRIK